MALEIDKPRPQPTEFYDIFISFLPSLSKSTNLYFSFSFIPIPVSQTETLNESFLNETSTVITPF